MTQRTSVPSRPPSAIELSPVALSPQEPSSARNLNCLSLEAAESLSPEDHSYPARAFGRATLRYYSFLQALLEGLLEYEAKKGERHAAEPIPAA